MFGFDSGWLWAIGGLVLLIAEVIAPGFFLFFIGVAATATGVLTLAFHLPLGGQVGSFLLFAALAVMVGRRWYTHTGGEDSPLLNNRSARLIGQLVRVVEAVDSSSGRVRIADGEWSARGGPADIGDTVRVTAVDGNCLTVTPSDN